jgi:autotransporter passenger strand-loop-strand repeat protein
MAIVVTDGEELDVATTWYDYDTNTYVSGTELNGVPVLYLSGVFAVTDTVVQIGGEVFVSSGGVANGTLISGGLLAVEADGVARGTLVEGVDESYIYQGLNIPGVETVAFGGVSSDTVVSSGGREYVGGVSSDSVVSNGGFEFVLPGGVSSDTVVSGGGNETVDSSGASIDTVISSGGSETIGSGGVSSDTVVTSGGIEVFYSGAFSSDTVISANFQGVSAGLSATGAIFNDPKSATVEFEGSAGADQSVVFSGGGGSLKLDDPQGFSGVISGFSHGDAIYLKDVSSIASLNWIDGTLAVVTNGGTIDLSLAGNYSSQTFIISTAEIIYNLYGISGSAFETDIGLDSSTSGSGGFTSKSTIVVFFGGVDSGRLVNSGITLGVFNNGATVEAIVGSGGNEFVYSGGISHDTVVSSGGSENVLSSGVSSETVVSSGGSEYVFSGGVSRETVVSGGGLELFKSGAVSSDTVISAGPQANGVTATVEFEGSADADQSVVFSGGGGNLVLDDPQDFHAVILGFSQGDELLLENVTSVASVNWSNGVLAVTLSNAGTIDLSLPGDYSNQRFLYSSVQNSPGSPELFETVITVEPLTSGGGGSGGSGGVFSSGNTIVVYGSGVDVGRVLSSGQKEYVRYGGITTGIVVSSGGYEYVSCGGESLGTIIDGGGFEIVSSGGVASDTVVNNGGSLIVSSGGSSVAATIDNGGSDYIAPRGTATGTVLLSGGLEFVDGAATGTIISGGAQYVISGIATAAMIESGGVQFVQDNGWASGTLISSGSYQNIYQDGSAIDTVISGGGDQYVYSGVASETTISSGGTQTIDLYGSALDTVISSGGIEILYLGAIASGVTVLNGGELVLAGGAVSGLTLSNGGIEIDVAVSSGATVTGVLVSGAIPEVILSGGSAIDTDIVSSGDQTVYFGGVAISTTISEAYQDIYGVASNTIVSGSGAGQYVYSTGVALDTIVDSGAGQFLYSGTASDTTISSGGYQTLYYGGTASGTVVSNGGDQFIDYEGTATGTVVSAGGYQLVSYGGVTVSTVISAGGYQIVSSGGFASDTTVSSGGVEIVLAGGSATNDPVESGGIEIVSSGGVDTGNVIESGGSQILASGGVASGADVQSGGLEIVQSGATASGTTIESGGSVVVVSGGMVTDPVSSGGAVTSVGDVFLRDPVSGIIDLGNAASGITVSGGVVEYVLSGGSVSSGTVLGGGTVEVFSGGAASGVVASGGIVDLASGAAIDVTNFAYAQGGAANLTAPDVLTITEGGDTDTLLLAGEYTGEYFHLSPDGAGGTDITTDSTPCYCPGTLILTAAGEVLVEDLAIGDPVMTVSGAARPIKWIGRRSYSGRFALGRKDILPIRIARGALDENIPGRDLWVSPRHALFLDGVLIEACDLVNGESIAQAEGVEQVVYIHIELETHDVILAEGAPAESFIDDDTRGLFHNAHEYRALYPAEPFQPARYCAPRLSEGFAVEAARRRIARHAGLDAPNRRALPLRGYVDVADGSVIAGWAQNPDHPEAPVCLNIIVGGRLIGQTLANRPRGDLAWAGLGSGRHGFRFALPPGVTAEDGPVEVRRAFDGRKLPFSDASMGLRRA